MEAPGRVWEGACHVKIAAHETLLTAAKLTVEQAGRLGLRGVEVILRSSEPPWLGTELKPCLIDLPFSLGESVRVARLLERARPALATARRWGSAGVAIAVTGDVRTPHLKEAIDELAALGVEQESRVLLTVRPDAHTQPSGSYLPLVELCRARDGRGIGLILDVEGAVLMGEAPDSLLRQGEGYVQHVRLPSPSWGRISEEAIGRTLRELHRVSYIDYVALYGAPADPVALDLAVESLREAIRTAWMQA